MQKEIEFPSKKPAVFLSQNLDFDARTVAWLALGRVLGEKAYARFALDAELAKGEMDSREVALANEILMGTLRYLPQLDRLLQEIPRLNLKRIPAKIVDLLRISVYQLLYLKRVPPYAIVNEAAKKTSQTGFPRLVGMINASLRKIDENRPTPFVASGSELLDLVEETMLPEWLAGRWLKQFGYAQTRELGLTLLKPAPLTLRVNTFKITVQDLAEQLIKLGFVTRVGTDHLPTLKLTKGTGLTRSTLYKDGYFYLQDESTLLAPLVLNPPPGAYVLDLCCGLGGKTTYLAQLMNNAGEIFAVDQNAAKLRLLGENSARLGFTIIKAMQADVLTMDCPFSNYVLLDSPCSNLGTIRHRPELKWSTTVQQLNELVRLERKLLARAAMLTKPEGLLVYSTCTMEPQEDEEIVESFLAENEGFELEDAVNRLPQELISGWQLKGPFVRTYPHLHDVDGAFVAIFKNKKKS